jgi:hypothetical protein
MKPQFLIERRAPEDVLGGLLVTDKNSTGASIEFASALIGQAKDMGIGLKDYCRLAIDPSKSKDSRFGDLNGWDAAKAFLNLPVRDDFDGGIMLRAASETFGYSPGTRALFPEVIDDMVQWKYKQTNFESLEDIVSQTRTVPMPEMITTVVNDAQADYTSPIRAIAEKGRIPVHSIQTTQHTVNFFKFGMGYGVTYEFNRRASLDLLTPYAARAQVEVNRAKVATATTLLINGDGVHAAAPVVNQSSFNTVAGVTATNGVLNYLCLLAWLVARAQAGYPIDTVVGNWDAYFQWIKLFSIPSSNAGPTDVEKMAKAGFNVAGLPVLTGAVKFVISSTAPANRLIGFSKVDTIEQQVEAGSLINESDRVIKTQEVVYTQTENSGFRIIFDSTRSVFNFGA